MKKLNSKIILVTGGATGIGLAISRKIALEGGTVIMCSRNENTLFAALKELESISDKNHYYFVTDVSKLEDIKLLSEWIKNKFGFIHGIVNCAGIMGPIGKITSVDMIEFNETMNINFMGTVYTCNIISKLFSSDYNKKIINFSGGGSTSPFPNYSAYSASKVAVVRFTENIAMELKNENFDINCISPGFVSTKIHQKTIEMGPDIVGNPYYNSTVKQIQDGGVSPELAADLVIFLLSNESNGITGKIISANWDNWKDESFQELLKTDKDFATIRRIDNKTFFKK